MWRLGWAIIFLGAGLSFCDFGGTYKPYEADIPESKRKAIAQKLVATEVKIKDAVWASSGTLLVALHDDGTSRDGYANYLCNILYEEGLTGKMVIVKVIDIDILVSKNKWVPLGRAFCE
jgi:hypothetical protein